MSQLCGISCLVLLSGLILCSSCVGSCGCCESVSAVAFCVQKRVLHSTSSHPLALHLLSAPSTSVSPSCDEGGRSGDKDDRDILLRIQSSYFVDYSLLGVHHRFLCNQSR